MANRLLSAPVRSQSRPRAAEEKEEAMPPRDWNDLFERLVRIEGAVRTLEGKVDDSKDDRAKIHEEVGALSDYVHKKASFIGGIVFAVSSVWAAFLAIYEFFIKR